MRVIVTGLIVVLAAGSVAPRPRAEQRALTPDDEPARRELRLAVVNTPDVVLESLIADFEARTRYDVSLQITESVYDLARAGLADLVIAHYGHAGTEAFVSDGLGRWPRTVFSNQAALIGPAADPAGIRGIADAAEAFRLIAARGGELVVNNAPTERYLAEVLWQASGAPPKARWQLDLGLRDQAAVDMAHQRGAYVLWGLVPFARLKQQRGFAMDALVLGDPAFQRIMVSIVVNRSRVAGVNQPAALAFERFLLEPATQARIRQFRHHGLRDQTWWPAGRHNAGAELSQF